MSPQNEQEAWDNYHNKINNNNNTPQWDLLQIALAEHIILHIKNESESNQHGRRLRYDSRTQKHADVPFMSGKKTAGEILVPSTHIKTI